MLLFICSLAAIVAVIWYYSNCGGKLTVTRRNGMETRTHVNRFGGITVQSRPVDAADHTQQLASGFNCCGEIVQDYSD